MPAFALVLNLDLILAGFGRGRRNILLFPDEIVLKGLLSFIAVGLSLQNRHSKSKSFERWGSYDLYFGFQVLYLSVISSDHSVDAPSSDKVGSVLEARKFHHCGSLFVAPVSADEDSLESAGLPPFDAV